MGLFDFFRKKPKKIAPSRVFGLGVVDLPNIELKNNPDGSISRYVLRFEKLIPLIQKHLEGTESAHAVLFARERGDADGFKRWFGRMNREFNKDLDKNIFPQGFLLASRYAKDVDRLVVDEIWKSATAAYLAVKQNDAEGHVTLIHFLVSGDRDYVQTYRNLDRVFGDAVTTKLYVCSWRDRLSKELKEFAGEENVLYLDDIVDFVANQQPNPNTQTSKEGPENSRGTRK